SAQVIVNGFGVPAPGVVKPPDVVTPPVVIHLLTPNAQKLDFVNVDGNYQGQQSVTFRNEGNDNVIVIPSITGENFKITTEDCSKKQMLTPRDQCVVTIQSEATAAARSGTL